MKIVVVYDSLYGNTERIARAIADAFPGDVPVLQVSEADPAELADSDLLIIGAPTHGSLPSEAAQALISRMGHPARKGAKVATFDTRLSWRFLERWGFAAAKIENQLLEKGWTPISEPGGFYVRGLRKGPLKKGEAERATAWAGRILEKLT